MRHETPKSTPVPFQEERARDGVGLGNGVIEISEISEIIGHLLPTARVQYNHLDAFVE